MELQQRQWTFLPESQSQADRKAAAARGDAQAQNTPGPTSADPAPSWLGSRLRRLRGIAHL
ncbi:MAG TPA: hypothetical protein VEB59_13300, partial [Gemmatimonadales bacterium]|nr:hypothetical protein [Gemmatimonadales bacterium]